jgi:hypothetical protein
VGDDVFLFDEHAAKHSVTLSDLGKVLNGFNDEIKETGGKFEFVSFHSCSMSSAEVAFQLQGTANYMLASQGPAFVGSWPYREILIRVFDDVNNGKLKTPYDVKTMLGKIYNYVYANSTDYLLAGYSFDLCLCDLSKDKLKNASAPLEALSKALVAGLENENPLVNYCILLAHWKSQSYFQENYTDLLDFCFCLEGYCNDFSKAVNDGKPFDDIKDACRNAMTVLMPSELEQSKNPVIHADFAGPDSQYSHGLSVFFPWTRPTADREIVKVDDKDKTEYEKYLFNQQTHWFRFLNQYWGPQELVESVKGSTMREPHTDERKPLQDANAPIPQPRAISAEEALREDIVSLMFNAEGPLSNQSALNDGPKTHPPDPTGDECTCGSIKNYKRDTRTRRLRGEKVNKTPVYTMNQKLLQDQNL